MAVEVILDLVEDAAIDIDKTRRSFVRTGYIRGIDTSLAPPLIMAAATGAPGMPVQYSGHPAAPYSLLNRYAFRTQKGVNNKIYFKLLYDTPTGANPAGASLFTLEKNRYLSNVQTQLHPKDKSDLRITWENPDDATQRLTPQTATMSYLQPMLAITATGYIVGELPAGYESAYGKVNETPWQGYPRGYFLYLGAQDKTEDFGNSYTVKLEFLTKVTEDWSSYSIFRDHVTGLNMPVKKSDADALRAKSYSYSSDGANGICKAGFYDLAEFNDIFGF